MDRTLRTARRAAGGLTARALHGALGAARGLAHEQHLRAALELDVTGARRQHRAAGVAGRGRCDVDAVHAEHAATPRRQSAGRIEPAHGTGRRTRGAADRTACRATETATDATDTAERATGRAGNSARDATEPAARRATRARGTAAGRAVEAARTARSHRLARGNGLDRRVDRHLAAVLEHGLVEHDAEPRVAVTAVRRAALTRRRLGHVADELRAAAQHDLAVRLVVLRQRRSDFVAGLGAARIDGTRQRRVELLALRNVPAAVPPSDSDVALAAAAPRCDALAPLRSAATDVLDCAAPPP